MGETFSKFSIPTLFIAGRKDQALPPSMSKKMSLHWEEGKLSMKEGKSHIHNFPIFFVCEQNMTLETESANTCISTSRYEPLGSVGETRGGNCVHHELVGEGIRSFYYC